MSPSTDLVPALIARGVEIPVPGSIEIDPAIEPDQISGEGVVIHAGCRIRGAATVIGPGCVLGRETPMTIESCQLGSRVELNGGYAASAVFLDGASLGSGAQVRAGTLLEEEASGAHTVGLKQSILFPFVTLGSLINFCDVLMAGGTSRKDHSEVGSSYIHFNFTPAGDKTTASLFGDVPRGVMLRERPIFLGGQGGTVGPARVAYGSVVGAGSILRADIEQENQLTLPEPISGLTRDHRPESYRRLDQIVAANLGFLAQIDALDAWYRQARAPFFAGREALLQGALGVFAAARAERTSRLLALSTKLDQTNPDHQRYRNAMGALTGVFGPPTDSAPEALSEHLSAESRTATYLEAISGLPADLVSAGTTWLQTIVDRQMAAATAVLDSH